MGQFYALLNKNWILYKRSICGNIIEILIPILFVGFMIAVSNLSPATVYTEQSYISNTQYSKTVQDITSLTALKQCQSTDLIALAPSSSTLIAKINTILTANSKLTQLFATESTMESYIRSQSYSSSAQICWGVIVQSQSANSYSYKLRFNISTGGNADGPLTTWPYTEDSGLDLVSYSSALSGGMIGANNLVNDAILQIESSSSNNHFRQYASPAYQEQYTDNSIYTKLSHATFFLLPLLILYIRQTFSMLNEKESKVRESMRIMGMKMRMYYLTWFIRYFIIYFIVHVIASAIFSAQLPNVPYYIPLIIFLMFDIALIIQNFFIQVFLSRAKLGIVISLLFFVAQFLIIVSMDPNQTEGTKKLMSIAPHMALVLALQNIFYFEAKQIQANFSQTINNYTLSTALISFTLNIAIYLVLLWYLDQVIPSQWGAKRHPLFCCFEKMFTKSTQTNQYAEQRRNSNVIEEVDKNFKIMEKSNQIIEIAGLRKEFNGGDLIAVDNLDLNIYKNQIFVLLGHNGAGKTTTISMLTGLLDPTEGFISVFGETEMDSIRRMLGVCPQYDTLYDDLTVEEHLDLYATFKGLDDEEREAEVNKLIRDVNLEEKRDEYTKNLSGGQKRRLSVAIAFAGKSKAIILDEPTSGMDTSARRYIWDLLKTYKNDRIIILTTHFMDQADFLGDRIGIMGGGKLLCCGSSIFLKNRFGIGYNITFVKQSSQISSQKIIKLVQKTIPTAAILSDVSSELSMQLPLTEIKKFSLLFNEIDSKKHELLINQYGISITTLEEVFLRVADEAEQKVDNNYNEITTDKLNQFDKNNNHYELKTIDKLCQAKLKNQLEREFEEVEIPRQQNGCMRFSLHFKATFIKRFRIIKRDLKTFLFQLLLPLILAIIALLLMTVTYTYDLPSQSISLQSYLSEQNPVTVPIGSTDTTLLTNLANSLSTKYGSSISLNIDTTDTTPNTFDYNYLFPRKKSQSTLKGGIYFLPSVAEGANTVYPFYSLSITRSPTSCFFLPTLASQAIINNQFSKNIDITVTNHPLPLTYNQLSIGTAVSGFVGAFVFSLALSFKFASVISFIVKQRQDRAKHQQIVSGMKISAYWISNLLYDYILYLAVALPIVGLCQAFNIKSLITGDAYTATALLFLSYGLAYIPFTYIVAFIFQDYGSAQSYYFFFTYLLGGMVPVLTFVFRIISADSAKIGKLIAWILRIDPAFAFGEALINIGSINLYQLVEGSKSIGPLDADISLGPILYLFIGFALYFTLLFVIEAVSNSQSMMRRFTRQDAIEDTVPITQSDVVEEYQKAIRSDPHEYEILTKHLRKVFMIDGRKKHKVAVDNLSFGIKKGEVFGLLGVNGAGKSTTFKMLSGQITSTSGDSYFCGLKISENLDQVRQSLGYCPQFDALIETLTVREQIQLYYDLKSLSSEYKEALIAQIIHELDLGEYEDKMSGTLSGGNKRKLSVAIAMIGNPKIIFLDEPSTGMDPKARRFMWKVISKIATERKQSTIILTTHSMEEAQALSTRLAIMVKGNFQCIGTPQHIKSKYGEGIQVQIKLIPISRDRIESVVHSRQLTSHALVSQAKLTEILDKLGASPEERIEISEGGKANHIYQILAKEHHVELELIIEYLEISFILNKLRASIEKAFGHTEIIETLQTFLKLKVVKRPNIGRMFDFFEDNKQHYGIQQYTIKQASVEQIFNRFAEIGEESSNRG